MFSCEICEIFMSTYFEEHLRTAASGISTPQKHIQYREKDLWWRFLDFSLNSSLNLFYKNTTFLMRFSFHSFTRFYLRKSNFLLSPVNSFHLSQHSNFWNYPKCHRKCVSISQNEYTCQIVKKIDSMVQPLSWSV